jgi:hypothetical protein
MIGGILFYLLCLRNRPAGQKFIGCSNQILITLSQSGQIHVGPLLIPHLFSSKHSGQIWNPQGQFQQNGFWVWQQLQI